MEKLIEAGGNPLFSRTQSGWLPLHTALSTRAPAYTAGNAGNSDAPGYKADLAFAPWLLGMMQACGDVSGLTTLPKGFVAKHGVDVEAFQRLLEKQCVAQRTREREARHVLEALQLEEGNGVLSALNL